MQTIPNKLKLWRNISGLRQQDVATALGITSTERISKWEQGLRYPSMVNLFKLSGIYGIKPHELYSELFDTIVNEVTSHGPT